MHGPATSLPASVSAWLLVLLCAVAGGSCLVRAGRAGRGGRGAAAAEALMGFGMALMAAPPGTGTWGPRLLLAVFCAAALHSVWLLRGGLHHVHHLVGSLAMAYMALTAVAPAGSPSAGGHGAASHGAGLPLVTGALLLYFAGYVLLGGARLVAAGGGRPLGGEAVAGDGLPTYAELAPACRLAMGIGMLAMLLAM
ncbi:DUF5134 domain-containing protein [Streptomyces sp. cmx-4-9]|uniref:DUF5134 domain-containing protein n=1 Tax=Streptomyces sp. cmx-4-9 TaxID=2790941 RepID=UPI00397EABB7